MAKFAIGKGAQANSAGRHNPGQQGKINLDTLTKKARYIVDENGRRQSVVVDYAAWQEFLRQAGEAGAVTTGTPEPIDSEYALRRNQAGDANYRPRPATGKDMENYKLETTVIRRGD